MLKSCIFIFLFKFKQAETNDYVKSIQVLERLLDLQKFEAPRISTQSAHESGEVVSPAHRPSLSPGEIFLVQIYVRG